MFDCNQVQRGDYCIFCVKISEMNSTGSSPRLSCLKQGIVFIKLIRANPLVVAMYQFFKAMAVLQGYALHSSDFYEIVIL